MEKARIQAVALFELEKVLTVKKEVTLEEQKFVDAWKFAFVRDVFAGALLGGTFGWIMPWRLSLHLRVTAAAVAGCNLVNWRYLRSITSCVDHILALDGTLMQKELKNIMLTRWGNSTHAKQYLARHFFLERVFDDSTSNQAKLRWRPRNFYYDAGTFDPRTHVSDPRTNVNDSDSNLHSNSNSRATIQNDNDSTRTDLNSKQTFMMPAPDSTDPLDSIFGPMGGTDEEIHHPPIASKTPTKLHNRGRKTSSSRRQRRMRQQKASTNSNASPAAG